jgi:hypothetical protein
LIRGIGYETVIIKNVPVIKGTTPTSSPTSIPKITMTLGSDYLAFGSITSPTGAWVDFYQTLQSSDTGTTEWPYDVRVSQFHPILGIFLNFPLSNSLISWGTYSSNPISFTTVTPAEGVGGYQAVAGALDALYVRSAFTGTLSPNVTFSAPTVTFGTLAVKPPWHSNKISGVITPRTSTGLMDTGVAFAVHGGLIVDAISTLKGDLPLADIETGGTYTISNLPGGTAGTPLPFAWYGVDVISWSTTTPTTGVGLAVPAVVDLSTGDATGIDMDMFLLP